MNIIDTNKHAIDYYQSISARMEEFCKPLTDHAGVSLFIYFKVYFDGSYILLTNDINLSKEYCSKIIEENLQSYVQLHLKNDFKKKLVLWPIYSTTPGTQIFLDKGYWHGVMQGTFNDDNIECYSFLGNKNNNHINEFFLSNHPILDTILTHFKSTNSDIISQSEQCKARYQNGYNFSLPTTYETKNTSDIQALLHAMGINCNNVKIGNQFIQLSPTQMQCLELVGQGYTIKEIAKVKLSNPRTIETHLSRIKAKTGLRYKSDLIKFCRENVHY